MDDQEIGDIIRNNARLDRLQQELDISRLFENAEPHPVVLHAHSEFVLRMHSVETYMFPTSEEDAQPEDETSLHAESPSPPPLPPHSGVTKSGWKAKDSLSSRTALASFPSLPAPAKFAALAPPKTPSAHGPTTPARPGPLGLPIKSDKAPMGSLFRLWNVQDSFYLWQHKKQRDFNSVVVCHGVTGSTLPIISSQAFADLVGFDMNSESAPSYTVFRANGESLVAIFAADHIDALAITSACDHTGIPILTRYPAYPISDPPPPSAGLIWLSTAPLERDSAPTFEVLVEEVSACFLDSNFSNQIRLNHKMVFLQFEKATSGKVTFRVGVFAPYQALLSGLKPSPLLGWVAYRGARAKARNHHAAIARMPAAAISGPDASNIILHPSPHLPSKSVLFLAWDICPFRDRVYGQDSNAFVDVVLHFSSAATKNAYISEAEANGQSWFLSNSSGEFNVTFLAAEDAARQDAEAFSKALESERLPPRQRSRDGMGPRFQRPRRRDEDRQDEEHGPSRGRFGGRPTKGFFR